MQTSSRNYALPGSHAANRRGHVPQLSISDDNHHVTEAIGDMYGDYQFGGRDSRPLSFAPSSLPNSDQRPQQASRAGPSPPQSLRNARNSLVRNISSERVPAPLHLNRQGANMPLRKNSADNEGGPLSPTGSIHRSNSDTANSQFPLNDIDYESNPNAVVQELNNLAALRRMSMDVNASGDPDLPSFSSNFGIPAASPVGTDSDDRARLYWVPASVHPELAPMEFKTFLDKKVKSLKRKSDEKALSTDSLSPGSSSSSLRRRKSMLSRQIDNSGGHGADGYMDGAERLERKRSQSGEEMLNSGIQNLQELEVLVNEPELVMQRLSLEAGMERTSSEVPPDEDMPILPAIPGGNNSLRRSTRTTYRRGGSLRKGERGPVSRRGATRTDEGEDSPLSSPITPAGEAFSLSRVQTEPTPIPERVTENFSRPGRMNRRQGMAAGTFHSGSLEELSGRSSMESRDQSNTEPQPKRFVSQIASNGRLGVTRESLGKGIPHIVETPPSDDGRSNSRHDYVPERTSSHEPPPSHRNSAPQNNGIPPGRSHIRQAQSRTSLTVKSNQTLNDMTSHPSPLPGNNTRTDSLSFIPTLTEDKKSAEQRKAKEKAEKESDGSRKTSWSWGSLLGNEEKEKEKRKAEEAKLDAKKVKSRLGKPADKSHDNARLDLLQTTMGESSRGRESMVLDRGEMRLEEERKKESSRKSAGSDTKKEKESGIFSSIFGGGKKKGERDSTGKGKNVSRNLSPEPPPRILKPDIDYNWTRFSILEERAIYRMAHIKLANPRRALHSQVLLSNFMYSYLAKVQQMHPQAQLPQSPAQRTLQAQQKKEQPEEFSQYQKYQEQQRRQQEQEEAQAQNAAIHQQTPALTPVQTHEPGSFTDADYDYEHPEQDGRHDGRSGYRPENSRRPQSRTSQREPESSNGGPHHVQGSHQRRQQQQQRGYNGQQGSPYQYQQSQFDEPGRASDDDMW